MKRDMKKWAAELIASPVKKPLPVLSFPAIQLMDITVRELISDADRQAEGMALIAARADTAAAVSLMDLSLEAEAFGSTIRVTDDEVPTVIGAVVTSPEEADALAVPAVGAGRTGIYLDAMRRACERITDRPVFAGVIGPFSLAARLLGVSEAMYLCYDEPEMVHTVLDKVTDFLISYSLAYKDTGANGIVMAEPVTGLLSADLAAEFSHPYVKRIIDAVQGDSFALVYHNCGGSVTHMKADIFALGATGYHFGDAIDLADMLPDAPADVLVMGNVSPAHELRGGTPESVTAATLAVLEKCSRWPNFVLSSGCDIPPLAPWENLDAFFAASAKFCAR